MSGTVEEESNSLGFFPLTSRLRGLGGEADSGRTVSGSPSRPFPFRPPFGAKSESPPYDEEAVEEGPESTLN